MNHPAQDLAGLARQILGHSMVVLLSHHDKAHQAAPDNARELIAEMTTLSAQRLAAATDEELRRRWQVLEEQRSQCFGRISAAQGLRSGRGRGDRFKSWRDTSTIDRAAEEKAQRDMSRFQTEKDLITEEIDRRANAQAARP
ncbi:MULTISPECIES: hypothetical protein [unclassified Pseudomonas]|uniref:hypothetical protein n=1 Tax=unclassified Pseudomonas TaxID=196821 RepID=UPI002361229E|nr:MULTISPECIES: hypothetical protein [unclassified Pseudomonas]